MTNKPDPNKRYFLTPLAKKTGRRTLVGAGILAAGLGINQLVIHPHLEEKERVEAKTKAEEETIEAKRARIFALTKDLPPCPTHGAVVEQHLIDALSRMTEKCRDAIGKMDSIATSSVAADTCHCIYDDNSDKTTTFDCQLSEPGSSFSLIGKVSDYKPNDIDRYHAKGGGYGTVWMQRNEVSFVETSSATPREIDRLNFRAVLDFPYDLNKCAWKCPPTSLNQGTSYERSVPGKCYTRIDSLKLGVNQSKRIINAIKDRARELSAAFVKKVQAQASGTKLASKTSKKK